MTNSPPMMLNRACGDSVTTKTTRMNWMNREERSILSLKTYQFWKSQLWSLTFSLSDCSPFLLKPSLPSRSCEEGTGTAEALEYTEVLWNKIPKWSRQLSWRGSGFWVTSQKLPSRYRLPRIWKYHWTCWTPSHWLFDSVQKQNHWRDCENGCKQDGSGRDGVLWSLPFFPGSRSVSNHWGQCSLSSG